MKVDERNVNIVLTQRVERHSYITIRIMNYEWFSPTKPKNSTTPPCGALSSSPYHSYAIHQVRINAVIGSKYECWESKEMLTRFSAEKITPFICLLQVNEKKC